MGTSWAHDVGTTTVGTMSFAAVDPVSASFRDAVGEAIDAFLATQSATLGAIGDELAPLGQLSALFTHGGKRLRPAFCYWGQVAAAGQPADPAPLLTAAASLDLLHVSALVHDDVMDSSDTRRGVPAAHRQLESLHAQHGWRGSPASFGRAGAILLGDLLLVWSAEMLSRAGLEPAALTRALPLLEAMRTEVTCGQFLDIVAQCQNPLAGRLDLALDEANRVVEYKTSRYTVQRPVQLGAALGGADEHLLAALAAYGSPLGRAFQFRDDLLGVFGDSQLTGKPAGDDLREGKRTVLVAHALAAAGSADAAHLDDLLGRRDLTAAQIDDARAIIDGSGARAAVEQTIEDGLASALAALDDAELTDEGRTALSALARLAVERQF